jgi:phosphomannomutase/phosphoglucomutase
LRLIEILASTGKRIEELLEGVPKTFSTPEIRVESPDDKKFEIVKRATEIFRKAHKVIDIDGVRVVFDDGWGLIRASNTQPALVLRFEALTENRLKEIQQLVESTLSDIKKNM